MGLDLMGALPSVVVLLLALSVHESAHAWSADRLGDPTARSLGRISLNPLVHADLFGTFLVPLMLYVSGIGIIFGWAKPVPVNVARLREPKKHYMLVAAAGPLSNVAMAGILLSTLLVLKASSSEMELFVNQAVRGVAPGLGGTLVSMAYYGIMINLILALFNMIPVAPLDGAAVLRGLVPEWLVRPLDAVQNFGFIILIALLYFGIPWYLFDPVIDTVRSFLVI